MNITAEELMEQLFRLNALLHRYQSFHFRSRGPLGDPHRGQGRVLSILKMQPEISQKDLGYLLDMRNQSLGELLAKLEQKGFITRTPSETDRRTMIVCLTDAGAEAAQSIGELKNDTSSLFEAFNEEERETLGGYLSRLIEVLETQLVDAGVDDRPFDHEAIERFRREMCDMAHGFRDTRVRHDMRDAAHGFRENMRSAAQDLRERGRFSTPPFPDDVHPHPAEEKKPSGAEDK